MAPKFVPASTDPLLLHPALWQRVDRLILPAMRARGWQPIVVETGRTQARGEYLEAIGRSKNGKNSLHCLKGPNDIQSWAIDIADADRHNVPKMTKEGLWDAPPKFWADLEDIGVQHGMHRLLKPGVKYEALDGDAESWDKPHLQMIPVSMQNKVRAMTPVEREAFGWQLFPALV